jgi:hypothetical protein
MSPLAEEMQKDEPSTKVTVPDPTGPAAVSAFQPAIPASYNGSRPGGGMRPWAEPSIAAILRWLRYASDSALVISSVPVRKSGPMGSI